MTPKTLVVARARVLIEIAILAAGCVVLTGDAAVVRIFGVVAGARALGVVGVRQAITVIVVAIAAVVDFALAGRRLTHVGGHPAATAGARAARIRRHTAAAGARRVITTDFDVLGTAEDGEACEPAENDGRCSKLLHGAPKVSLGRRFVDHPLVCGARERLGKSRRALIGFTAAIELSQGFDRDHFSLLRQYAIWKARAVLVC